jgi:hypothetical protein
MLWEARNVSLSYNLLIHWRQERTETERPRRTQNDAPPRHGNNVSGASFTTDGAVIGRNGQTIECYVCKGNHYAYHCPDRNDRPQGHQHAQNGEREEQHVTHTEETADLQWSMDDHDFSFCISTNTE